MGKHTIYGVFLCLASAEHKNASIWVCFHAQQVEKGHQTQNPPNMDGLPSPWYSLAEGT